MKVKIESSKIVKPSYEDGEAPAHAQWVPLSVLDKVTYGEHVALIFAFRPPNPPNSEVQLGLAKALAVYREWAGQNGDGPDGRRSVLLNDAGARFVEATVDAPMAVSVPSEPSPVMRWLHPSIDDGPVELVQVQLTHFSCGSLAVGFAGHHQIADGQASSRLPPSRCGYTTFQSVVAHLWRAITAARGLGAGMTTKVRISVNGRTRMRPAVPRDYFGNMVLWAFPRSDAGELVSRPVGHAAELVYRAVAGVDDAYFRSFVDFASSGAVEAEGLVPTADSEQAVLCPDLEVDAWLGINFHGLDFGGGSPIRVMPTYYPMEGSLFMVPSTLGDGSMEAYVALFDDHLAKFKRICHKIE